MREQRRRYLYFGTHSFHECHSLHVSGLVVRYPVIQVFSIIHTRSEVADHRRVVIKTREFLKHEISTKIQGFDVLPPLLFQ